MPAVFKTPTYIKEAAFGSSNLPDSVLLYRPEWAK